MIIFQIELDYLTGGFSSAAESPFGFFAKTCKVINGNDSSQFVSMISDEVLRSDSDIDMNTSLEYKNDANFSQEEMTLKWNSFAFASSYNLTMKCGVEVCLKENCPMGY
jgi:hypothetical protein